jgi:hypothetical protein
VRAAALVAASLTALLLPAALLASPKTTRPSKKITLAVIIYDTKISVQTFSQLGSGPTATLNPVAGPIPRGDFVSINIYNAGKKVHDFSIFGKKTKPIKPKGKAHIFLSANVRGNFVYKSTLDKGLTGRVIVA